MQKYTHIRIPCQFISVILILEAFTATAMVLERKYTGVVDILFDFCLGIKHARQRWI
jgi:hypothetical protein